MFFVPLLRRWRSDDEIFFIIFTIEIEESIHSPSIIKDLLFGLFEDLTGRSTIRMGSITLSHRFEVKVLSHFLSTLIE